MFYVQLQHQHLISSRTSLKTRWCRLDLRGFRSSKFHLSIRSFYVMNIAKERLIIDLCQMRYLCSAAEQSDLLNGSSCHLHRLNQQLLKWGYVWRMFSGFKNLLASKGRVQEVWINWRVWGFFCIRVCACAKGFLRNFNQVPGGGIQCIFSCSSTSIVIRRCIKQTTVDSDTECAV